MLPPRGWGLLPAALAVLFSLRAARADRDAVTDEAINVGYRLTCAYATFYMQAGFLCLEAGRVRSKNLTNIMLKNTADVVVCTISFFVVGYALGFGGDQSGGGNAFVGTRHFLLVGLPDEDLSWFFLHTAYAATAATIVSGSMAERTVLPSYMMCSAWMTAWVYPVAAHWVWSPSGWLHRLGPNGAIDVAGGALVHCTGGIAGLMGTLWLGPRAHRFDEKGRPRELREHSLPLQVLGTMILIFSWFSFNTASVGALAGDSAQLVAKTAAVTLIGASSGGMSMIAIGRYDTGIYTISSVIEGVLSGLVSITPACAVVEPWAALIIGAGSSFVVHFATRLLMRWQIDDPLNNVPIHLGAGSYGMVCTGVFATTHGVCGYLGRTGRPGEEPCEGGVVDGKFALLGINTLATVCICLWTVAFTVPVFYALRKKNMLRVDINIELAGLDYSSHGVAEAAP